MLKNRLIYLVVVITLLLLIYLYEGDITYAALYAALILPVLSLMFTLLLRRRFTVEESLARDNIIKGETTQYIFKVRNNSFLPCISARARFKSNSYFVVADFVDKYFTIQPYRDYEVVFDISAKHRGKYEIGVLDITAYDFLGLFRFRQKHNKALTLTVNPRVLDIFDLPLYVANNGAENAKNLMAEEDYAVISDLRKYQPTDGYKKIHWKVSAKKNELVSKNYQNTRRNSVALLVDNSVMWIGGETAAIMEDGIMEGCVSTLAYCLRRQQLCTLYYMGDKSDESPTDSFNYLYTKASAISFDSNEDFGTYFENFAKMRTDAENILILTQKLNDRIFAAAQGLAMLDSNVIIFYFKDLSKENIAKIELIYEHNINFIDFRNIISQ